MKRSRANLGRAAGLVLAAMLAPMVPALAQSVAPAAPSTAGAAKPDPLCASYGAGFTRLAGSSTCVKIGSSLQTDAYGTDISNSARVDALAPALKSK